MRQFLQEDKGVTCIGTQRCYSHSLSTSPPGTQLCEKFSYSDPLRSGVFGLPGESEGDEAVRATKAALRIFQSLQKGGLHATIGVTTGKAYCGIIGNAHRHEYGACDLTGHYSVGRSYSSHQLFIVC